jgi:hypothetical protein
VTQRRALPIGFETMTPAMRRKLFAALRGIAANPDGLRMSAHPSAMPILLMLGLIRMRERGDPAWILTTAGNQIVADFGSDET